MASLSLFVSESAPLESPMCPVELGAVIGGKYRVRGTIASGGMGVVFEAEHVLLESRVAIKVVRPELATHEAIERFTQEAKIAARLRSPHVARVLDTGRLDNGIPYLVMEHLEGEDLCERLQRSGRLGIAQAVDYVLQVCEGLAEAHAAGLVHRDLKPENLFVTHGPDRDELVKILDFGITKLPARIGGRSYTEPGSSVGSPHYMAPEQMNTPNDVDARADIWTLGVVLYESLAGRAPFEGDTIPAVCAQVLSARPVRLRTLRPDVPMALERAVMCCLENDRRARYADVFELARAIVAFGAPGAGLRMERIRRIVGSASPPVEVDRVSDIPVHLTRRRSVPAKPIKKSFGLYGAALASIGALGLATASTAQKMILPSFTLAPVAAVASRPLATPEFVPGPSGARTGALIAALPEVESETETARPSPPRPAPARRYTRASRRAAASKAPPPEATEPAAAKPKQPGPYDEPADGEAEPSATPTADSFRPPEP